MLFELIKGLHKLFVISSHVKMHFIYDLVVFLWDINVGKIHYFEVNYMHDFILRHVTVFT
jgi:hypothetical protein